jgi:low affinity Fe/Cu permease
MVANIFHKIAQKVSEWVGSPKAFFLALFIVVFWALSGKAFGYSDTWQLIINTGTTILTFLMVFLIQNTQNRDAKATHLKLDEIIRSLGAARNQLMDVEDQTDEEINKLQSEFIALSKEIAPEEKK